MKRKKIVPIVLAVLLLGVFGFSAYKLGGYYLEKYRSDQSVAEAAKFVRLPEASVTDKDSVRRGEWLEVDFDSLWELNGDIVAWLYCPDTPINYPVVQSHDNDYYLRRLLDGSYNIAGTLFLDYRCIYDLSVGYNIIYGHNMNTGAMFGSLDRYRSQSYYDEHPYFYLVTPSAHYRVELFAGCTVAADDDIYSMVSTGEHLQSLVDRSTFRGSSDHVPEGPVLIMSTCVHDFEDARYVLVGSLVPME